MSSTLSLLSCQNPFCIHFKKKGFKNQAALTNHIDRSPGCYNYLANQTIVALPHGASVVGRRRQLDEDVEVTWTSNKRPSLLRRNKVNDVVIAEGGLPICPMPLYPDVHLVGASGMQRGGQQNLVANDTSILEHIEDDEDGHDTPADFDGDGPDDSSVQQGLNAMANTQDVDFEAPSFRSNFMYTTDQKWTVSLLKILDNANAQDYAFGQVLEWARKAAANNYSFNPVGGLSHAKNVDALINSVRNGKQMLPFTRRVLVPHGPPSDVICFDFVAQLLSLLQNRSIMTAENLAIDINNPLKPYFASEGNVLGEAISGSVYRQAYKRLITDPSTQLFVPIIQWIDRTTVTGNDRFSLKPYMFTPAIFTEKFRRSIKAWGYHGFLPKRKTSSAQNQVLRQGDPTRNYHAELDGVLESFRECAPRLRGVFLPMGPTGLVRVDIVTCLLFVIQDMQEGDSLCGRYGVHTPGIRRHCRSCNVNYDDLENFNVRCSFLTASSMDNIAKCGNKETRKQWSQHEVDNAFNRVVFADPDRGIFGATPVETMHAFRKGVVEYVTKFVLENVPASKKAAFDDLAIGFHKSHRQAHRKAYPSTDFSNGVTNLTMITASERLGLVFLFVILFQYDEGWRIIQECLDKGTNDKVPKVLEVLESILTFDAWMNQTSFWDLSNPVHVAQQMALHKRAIRKFMEMCTTHIPIKSQDENAWKFPKFHELLHLIDDMSRFGSPVNFCAQRPESLLKDAAKRPGKRAQKRRVGSAFELQAAQRLMHSKMIDTVHTRIWGEDPTLPNNRNDTVDIDRNALYQGTGQATFGWVSRVKVGKCYQYKIAWDTKTHLDLMKLPPNLMEFVCNSFPECKKIEFCTEYQRGHQPDDVHTFRCHPSYQSDGAIYDWMIINFGEEHGNFPCRLVLVVVLDPPEDPDEKYQLIVQCTTEKVPEHESNLLREWKWSPEYTIVPANAIVAPSFVISITHDGTTVLEAKPYQEWASKFA